MQSRILSIYKRWLATATPEQVQFVDSVYALCEKHYSAGGDTVVECLSPQEVLDEFTDLDSVRSYCGLMVEQATNTRWGEDTDQELARMRAFEGWPVAVN